MAHYNATVSAPRPGEQVFAYLVDFRSVVEWDPSMKSSDLVQGEHGALGSRYRLTIDTPGRDTVIEHELVELEAPSRFVLRGETDALVSVDTVTVASTGAGQRGQLRRRARAQGSAQGGRPPRRPGAHAGVRQGA